MAFQQEPHAMIWGGRGDGTLLGFTYDREQEVYGWHPHEMGGVNDVVVESGVTIPSPDGTQDDVWLIVQRASVGLPQRTSNTCAALRRRRRHREAWYLDAALDYYGSTAIDRGRADMLRRRDALCARRRLRAGPLRRGGGTITLTRPASA
jgi:hypothetical protein